MTRVSLTPRTAALALSTAVAATLVLASCSNRTEEQPTETKAPTQSSSVSPSTPMSPTEKQNVGSFAPAVTAKPAPTALPGRHRW